METKKTKQASIEKLRFPIGLTALLFTGSVVLASFSFTSGFERDLEKTVAQSGPSITYIDEPTKVDPPQVTPPQQEVILPPTENIIIDSNNQKEPPKGPFILPPPDIKVGDPVVYKEKEVIEWPDVEAKFPGGAAEMQRWIAENVQYPQTSIELNEQGKVFLSFVVEEDGSISQVEIERSVSGDLDKEAKRLLRKMPHWIPGEAKGQKARTRCRLPINFTLN